MMISIRRFFYKPKKSDTQLLARFYYAEEELKEINSELENYDGRSDPEKCLELIRQLRVSQDKVLDLIVAIMDVAIPDRRANRDFRLKFPDDVVEESLAGLLWFGAECLAVGSSIMNREMESAALRPLAKKMVQSLANLRVALQEQCYRNLNVYTEKVNNALIEFDQLFSDFEYSYVNSMVPVKTARDYELLQDISVLFCETVDRALSFHLLAEEQIEECEPALMFTIPRLAIVCGLLIYPEGPLNVEVDLYDMSEIFRPYHKLLCKIKQLLQGLSEGEVYLLEKTLSNADVPWEQMEKELLDLSSSRDGSSMAVAASGEGNSQPSLASFDDAGGSSATGGHELAAGSTEMGSTERSSKQAFRPPPPSTREATDSLPLTHLEAAESPLDSQPLPAEPEASNAVEILGGSATSIASAESASLNGSACSICEVSSRTDSSASANLEDPDTDLLTNTVIYKLHAHGLDSSSSSSSSGSITSVTTSDDELETVAEPAVPLPGATSSSHPPDNFEDSDTSSCSSAEDVFADNQQLALAVQEAEKAIEQESGQGSHHHVKNRVEIIHKLFICISAVADQLQTNSAGDLRNILKTVFEVCLSKPEKIAETIEGSTSASGKSRPERLTRFSLGQPQEAPPWLPDDLCNYCSSCKAPFNMVRRRHHCRNCGKIFCGNCSSNFVPLPHYGVTMPVRVCSKCFAFHAMPFLTTRGQL